VRFCEFANLCESLHGAKSVAGFDLDSELTRGLVLARAPAAAREAPLNQSKHVQIIETQKVGLDVKQQIPAKVITSVRRYPVIRAAGNRHSLDLWNKWSLSGLERIPNSAGSWGS
jgi:hypothetical protein